MRLDLPLDASFDAIISESSNLDLRVCRVNAGDQVVWASFADANIYHITSAKDDLPKQWFVTADFLERAPDLLAVCTSGAGFDTVDVAACTRAGVIVFNQTGSNAAAVAEHAMGLILSLARRINECDRRLRRGERFTRSEIMGEDIEGRTIGLIGIGNTGRRVAAHARAFGMNVLACDPFLSEVEITARGASARSLDALLREADVVSVHCPLDDSTRGMIGPAAIATMKPGTLLVCTARGGICDEHALYEALKAEHLGGVGLDVWAVEPPPATHPLLSLDKVVATHHVAGVTPGARRSMARMAADQILGLTAGKRPHNLINPAVIPSFVDRYARITGVQLGW